MSYLAWKFDRNFPVYWTAVRLGSNISEIVKGKLSLGARILQVGGLRKIYKQLFSDGDSEKLLKAAQCYLSTTAGPIAGLLFISTDKIAFCSDRSIKVSSSAGELIRFHYKVWLLSCSSSSSSSSSSFFLCAKSRKKCLCSAGSDSSRKNRENQWEWECEEAFTEVHRNSYSW